MIAASIAGGVLLLCVVLIVILCVMKTKNVRHSRVYDGSSSTYKTPSKFENKNRRTIEALADFVLNTDFLLLTSLRLNLTYNSLIISYFQLLAS